MNTSIIKKEIAEENNQHALKISRRITGNTSIRKNDLITILREENNLLYENYLEVIKRNAELRLIVEKQQKLINVIYNAELKITFPAEEKEETKEEPEIKLPVLVEPHPEEAVAPHVTEPLQIAETPVPEIKKPEPLGLNDLAKRIARLRRKKLQSQPSLIKKAKFLLALYNAPGSICITELFASCGITRISGMRYGAFFRNFGMVTTGGYCSITEQGKKFVEGASHTEWDKFLIKRWRNVVP